MVSDRDTHFTSCVWDGFHKALGTKLKFNNAFYPLIDEESERTIQVSEDMLTTCVLDLGHYFKYYFIIFLKINFDIFLINYNILFEKFLINFLVLLALCRLYLWIFCDSLCY